MRIGAMISGGGRTLLNIADAIDAGRLDACIATVISSSHTAAGVERAASRGLDVQVAASADFDTDEQRHAAITQWLVNAGVELVCLCGYLKWLHIDERFAGRVLNIHPSLLPDFGGHGMYGTRVHRAVLEAGRRISGCTVHFVDGVYDHGPIVLQRACPVLPDDDAGTLAERVFAEECIAFPAAIELFAAGRLRLGGGRVEIQPEGERIAPEQ